MDFKYTITDKKDYTMIALNGSLIEIHQADDLMHDLNELFIQEKIKFVIDLGQLEFINQTGIAILLKLLTLARINGGELTVCNLSDNIKKLPEGEKIKEIFTPTDNELLAAALLN